jgi:hypothetical protein
MHWVATVPISNTSHLHIASTGKRWFLTSPSLLLLPQSDRNPATPSLPPAIPVASRLPAAIPVAPRSSSMPEGGDWHGAEVDDAAEIPRPASSVAATVPVRDLLAQRPSSACAQHRLNSSQSRIPRRSSSHGVRPMAALESSASDPWWRSGAPPTHGGAHARKLLRAMAVAHRSGGAGTGAEERKRRGGALLYRRV